MLLEIPPQDGVDPRLIALALRAEPLKHIGVEPQRHMRFVARFRQLGGEPVDLFHRIIGVAAGRQRLFCRGFPVSLDRAALLHRPQLSGRALDDIS